MDIAGIIEDLSLPVVVGMHRKASFGLEALTEEQRSRIKPETIQNFAAVDCLVRADRWLVRFAPNELATVVHEDGSRVKPLMKKFVQILRSEEHMDAEGLDFDTRKELGLPLSRIIDTVHFADKTDARPLQLADLCAFMLARGMQGRPVIAGVWEIIWNQLRWLMPSGDLTELRPTLEPGGVDASDALDESLC